MFSILIPTWNNLPYLKLCVDSIRRHSAFEHEIIVHVNDGSDGTREWVEAEGLRHTHSAGNVGVCVAMNDAARLATRDWILFMNDDMFCTPGWDSALVDALQDIGHSRVYLASQIIEPTDTGNAIVEVGPFGTGPADFDEAGMLAFAAALEVGDRNGTASQPMLVSRELWHRAGGYAIEFGPGMSSDDDFLMRLWLLGCRVFRQVGASRVYHFGCRTTDRIRRNRGGREFLMKWGVTQHDFKRNYLAQTAEAGAAARLPNVPRPSLSSRVKRVMYAFGRYPTEDLEAWEPDLPRQVNWTTPVSSRSHSVSE